MYLKIYIPVKNEEIDLLDTIQSIRKNTDDKIIVVDNNSTDNSKKIALENADSFLEEKKPGKGEVVKKIIAETDADVIFLTDGDSTYDMNFFQQHKELMIKQDIDMIVGHRKYDKKYLKRYERKISNKLYNMLFRLLIGGNFNDICSGYRFLKVNSFNSLKIISKGFEIETELSILAIQNKMKIKEVVIDYKERVNSKSKLKSFEDSFKIVLFLLKSYLKK